MCSDSNPTATTGAMERARPFATAAEAERALRHMQRVLRRCGLEFDEHQAAELRAMCRPLWRRVLGRVMAFIRRVSVVRCGHARPPPSATSSER